MYTFPPEQSEEKLSNQYFFLYLSMLRCKAAFKVYLMLQVVELETIKA
jgi:hypothetical protein